MNYGNQNKALNDALANSYQKTDPTRFCYTATQGWKPEVRHPCRINYVIATWSGARRAGNDQLLDDPIIYLQQHLAALKELTHELTQITVMVPYNADEPKKFTVYLDSLSDVKILRRENEGQSYGSYIDCYKHYKDQFDYYIFVEDDYIPKQQNFDQILVQMFNGAENCGYLCSRVDKYPPTEYMGRPHAAISNGITSAAVLKSIADQLGSIPCGRKATAKHAYAATPQLEFSWGFLDTGWWLYDYSPFYCSPYHHVGKLQHYGSIQKPPLFVPVQLS
jgi:hypothetical protein